jgi:hypothetical protein
VEDDGEACVAMTDSQIDVQGGQIRCLTGLDLTDYDYVSVSGDRFFLISVKLTTSMTRFTSNVV